MAADRREIFGYVALNCCTILWGTQHAVIKGLVVATPLPSLVNAIRFSVAAIVTTAVRALLLACGALLLPSTASGERPGVCGLLIGAAELAVWQTLGFSLQLIGLHWTTASRSAFLLYLNAFFVPIVATSLGEQGIGLRTWVCVGIAVLGTGLLINDGGAPNIGDVWSIGAALASAMFIVRLTRAGRGRNAVLLSAATLAFTSAGCWLLAALAAHAASLSLWEETVTMVVEHGRSLGYLAVVVSGLSSWLQAAGQQAVPAHEAAVIYTLDPCWGALFAWLLLGERLGWMGWVGVAMVVVANLGRRLPWHEWRGVRGLVTPAASEVDLVQPGGGGGGEKRAPLLGTPKTPGWWRRAWGGGGGGGGRW